MAFIKHNQENNKDLSALQEIEERLARTRKVYKNYLRAQSKGTLAQKTINPCIEQMYQVILDGIKKLYSSLHCPEDKVLVELNRKDDPTDSSGIFCIMTPTLYFSLECDILSNFKIEYLFHNSPFEAEIKHLIKKHCMESYSVEVVKQPDYPTFFKNVLRRQPERFIRVL